MKKIKIHLVAATRPNFMKVAPLYHKLKRQKWTSVKLIHTGQHYDNNMSAAFFTDLNLPNPNFNLNIRGNSHAEQTAGVILGYEKILINDRPDLVIVVGDVNSTMATAITAKKLGIKIGHVEAGLRSYDITMPEEINRIITDSISDIYWTHSIGANNNLIKEGVSRKKIFFAGNIMIDSYLMMSKKIDESGILDKLNLKGKKYIAVTCHRPVNVDNKIQLKKIVNVLVKLAGKYVIVFPVHPRTKKNLEAFGLTGQLKNNRNIVLQEPLNYINFMKLIKNAGLIITDSGGIQEETTYLKIPCLTLRESTERPITINNGSNKLIKVDRLYDESIKMIASHKKGSRIPRYWDGKTSDRIVESIKKTMFPPQK